MSPVFFLHPNEEWITFLLLLQPGDTKSVSLVSIGGNQVIRGGNNIVDSPVDDSKLMSVMNAVQEERYGFSEEADARLWRFYFFYEARYLWL